MSDIIGFESELIPLEPITAIKDIQVQSKVKMVNLELGEWIGGVKEIERNSKSKT